MVSMYRMIQIFPRPPRNFTTLSNYLPIDPKSSKFVRICRVCHQFPRFRVNCLSFLPFALTYRIFDLTLTLNCGRLGVQTRVMKFAWFRVNFLTNLKKFALDHSAPRCAGTRRYRGRKSLISLVFFVGGKIRFKTAYATYISANAPE